MKIESIKGELGTVSVGGVTRKIGLTLMDNPRIGDYVLVHAGFAIQKINKEEADETIKLLKELIDDNEISL